MGAKLREDSPMSYYEKPKPVQKSLATVRYSVSFFRRQLLWKLVEPPCLLSMDREQLGEQTAAIKNEAS